ncbi:MAG: ABC transporter permease [Ferruginibacter sp.]
MFSNYFKTAYRNLTRNKGYALLNIAGLAIGIAACLLIFLVIQYETSFDNFHAKKDNIYRIGSYRIGDADRSDHYSGGVSFPVGPALAAEFPQVKKVARILQREDEPLTIQNADSEKKKFKSDLYYCEPGFFNLFDFEWLSGNAKAALMEPNSVVLSKTIAEKYFGDWHAAIGKTFMRGTNKNEIYTVKGILNDVPVNTDFPLEVMVSYSTLLTNEVKDNLNDWMSTWSQAYTFVELPSNVNIAKFNADLIAFAKRHKPAEYAKDAYIAQPFSEIHFDDRFGNFTKHIFSRSLIFALQLIALFLVLIACVNFINLATAQAVNRSKEVGVRKVLGSNRKQLALQFLSETAIITGVSLLVAIALAYFSLPFLNTLLNVKIALSLTNPVILLFLTATFVLVTFMSGIYPAIVLSGFNPITALKTKITSKMVGGISLRRALVVLQFGIAHVLIIGTLIVVSQMNFFRNASLGFDKDAIINVPIPDDSASHAKVEYLKQQLLQNAAIKNVSASFGTPSSSGNWSSDFKFDHSTKATPFSTNLKWADVDYFKTYGLKFVAGRPFYTCDTVREIVVNETMLSKLSITDPKQAIGKEINLWDGQIKAPIVGVVKDFNVNSLRSPIGAVLIAPTKNLYYVLGIKTTAGKEKEVLAYTEKLWNATFPDYIYAYEFLDQRIANYYRQENQLAQLYKIFAFIAIFISCLGLYGLVSFMAAQRTKEVGIRKVLGATPAHIVYLLSKEFSLLIIIAFVIASPIAYYIMHKWLQNYTYRIPLSASIFIMAIVGSMIIAWLTVGYRAVKAALANPVKNLRTE